MTLRGQPDWNYRVETSADRVNWTLLREVPSGGALTEFKNAETAIPLRKNFRVSLKP